MRFIEFIYLFIYLFVVSAVLFLVDGCETWSVVVREEHRLRIFKRRALRKVFAARRERT
jgi:hypothetical protein